MKIRKVSTTQLREKISQILDQLEEDPIPVLVMRHGTPIAKLEPTPDDEKGLSDLQRRKKKADELLGAAPDFPYIPRSHDDMKPPINI